ncbi:MAG: ribosomal protein S18-alanine N-acetyltransferase [Gammaproteobacteria bacterium]|jgi:ribosomal-protein-alanine N-acetyltransferase
MSVIRRETIPEPRPMVEADIPAILRIERRGYAYPWSAGIFRDCLRVGYCCWVQPYAGDLAGYGIISVAAGECHVLNVCVDVDLQGRGFGRRLMEHLLEVARGHGAEQVFLEVRPTNLAAVALYRSLDFHEVGLRHAYYPADGGREDALVMARAL